MEGIVWSHDEIIRIKTLYHEARESGQDERAEELVDELYELSFDRYQKTLVSISYINDIIKKQPSPEIRKVLGNLRGCLIASAEEVSKSLNKFFFGCIRYSSRFKLKDEM